MASTVTNQSPSAAVAAPTTFNFYFAGGLFDGHQLLGNAHLCEAVERLSQRRFTAVMPQNVELRDMSPQAIRDEDLLNVWRADIAIIQLNGLELDSGTVVELMAAKMADIPVLLLRTDFRAGGDQGEGGDPWNLMVSNYPRSQVVNLNAMALYKTEMAQESDASASSSVKAAARATDETARAVIKGLGELLQKPVTMRRETQKTIYAWLAHMPDFKGGSAEVEEELVALVDAKQAKGLL